MNTEPQFHRQDRLGSCLVAGWRRFKIKAYHENMLVPAWHYLVVRENSLTRNPGATLESPSHPLSWDESPSAPPHRQNRFPRAEAQTSESFKQFIHGTVAEKQLKVVSWRGNPNKGTAGLLSTHS